MGAWLNKQREYYRCILRGTQCGSRGLSDARIAQLDAMGFCWNVEVTRDGTEAEVLAERSWNENLRKLEAYRAQHGDCCVSKSYNGPLANFVACARRAFKKQQEYKAKVEAAAAEGAEESLSSKGMPHKHWLTPTRIWQLNELGFTWAIRDAPVDIWNDRYEKLREFKEKFGHCRVPIKYDKALSQWILSMRHYYKNTMDEKKAGEKKLGKLSADKIFRLQRLGFEWEVKEKVQHENWEARFRDMIRCEYAAIIHACRLQYKLYAEKH